MKTGWIWAIGLLLMGSCSCGTSRGLSGPAGEQEVEVPARTELQVEFDKDIDSGKMKTGDSFTAHLATPVLAQGKEAIPRGTKFRGAVTNSQPAKQAGATPYITLTLNSFDLRGNVYDIQTEPQTLEGAKLTSDPNTLAHSPEVSKKMVQARENATEPKGSWVSFFLSAPVRVKVRAQ
jgi:hypothetical protein